MCLGDTFCISFLPFIMHKQKIDMSDGIFVVNVDGYIGNSTKSEIKY